MRCIYENCGRNGNACHNCRNFNSAILLFLTQISLISQIFYLTDFSDVVAIPPYVSQQNLWDLWDTSHLLPLTSHLLTGNVTVNSVYSSQTDSTLMSPPWFWIISRLR